MPNGEKKGITVRIDADLHTEVSRYLRDHGITMAEFVTLALDDELHPKYQIKEQHDMANTRTIAVQIPESMFQRIKEYLQRNNMTQKEFLIGLISDELKRDQARCQGEEATQRGDYESGTQDSAQKENTVLNDYRSISGEETNAGEGPDLCPGM